MAQQTFRTALNGFNRDDVVHYIEFLNAQHSAEVARLQSELEFLRGNTKPAAPAEEKVEPCQYDDLIEQQAARIRELFDLCKEKDARIAQLESAPQTKSADDELEAYRRAERTERLARERAEQVQRQANAVLADATAKVDEAAALIEQMALQVSGQLGCFQSAVDNTKAALRDAVATMGTIRPESDNQ